MIIFYFTKVLGIPAHELKNTVYKLLRGTVTLKETITKIGDRGRSFVTHFHRFGRKEERNNKGVD